MSTRASPAVIGAFALGAIALAVGLVIFVTSLKLFSQEETFVLYFNESVNGLSIGSPVKLRGVPIGRVSDVRINWNQVDDSVVPVLVSIDLTRLSSRLGASLNLEDDGEFYAQVRRGLRGKLQIESLITNLLFVELTYVGPGHPARFWQDKRLHKEIPTIPSAMAAFGESAPDLLAKFIAIDTKAISDGVVRALDTFNQRLEALDTAGLSTSFNRMAVAVADLAQSPALASALEQLDSTLHSYRILAERLDGKVGPLADEARSVLADMNQTLGQVSAAVEDLRMVLHPESPLLYEAARALESVGEAARAARGLLNAAERQPNIWLTGKPENTAQP